MKPLFVQKLRHSIRRQPVEEVPGASEFLSQLRSRNDVIISFATGAWYDSAVLKLNSAGIDFAGIPIASAEDHISRVGIMKIARSKAGGSAACSCTYFGDGAWDRQACKELGINFVAVGGRVDHAPGLRSFVPMAAALAALDL